MRVVLPRMLFDCRGGAVGAGVNKICSFGAGAKLSGALVLAPLAPVKMNLVLVQNIFSY